MNLVSSQSPIYLIGARAAYSEEIAAIVREGGFGIPVLVDNLKPEPKTERNWVGIERLAASKSFFLLCPSPPGARQVIERSLATSPMQPSRALSHPAASIDPSAILGTGSTINRLVAIGHAVQIGNHCQVNRLASIGHETKVGNFATLGPACTLTGEITVGDGAFIGAGAVVLPGLSVGANSVVGAGAVVVRDVQPFTTVVGNPAKEIESSGFGYAGFTVTESNQ